MITSISQIRAVTPSFEQVENKPEGFKFSFAQKLTRSESFRSFGLWARKPIDTHFGRLHIQTDNARLLISSCVFLALSLILYLL